MRWIDVERDSRRNHLQSQRVFTVSHRGDWTRRISAILYMCICVYIIQAVTSLRSVTACLWRHSSSGKVSAAVYSFCQGAAAAVTSQKCDVTHKPRQRYRRTELFCKIRNFTWIAVSAVWIVWVQSRLNCWRSMQRKIRLTTIGYCCSAHAKRTSFFSKSARTS